MAGSWRALWSLGSGTEAVLEAAMEEDRVRALLEMNPHLQRDEAFDIAGVVTHVQSAEELEALSFSQQGDEEMYTAANLKRRQANRNHPAVLAELEIWWDATVDVLTDGKGCSSVAEERKLRVTSEVYVEVFTKVGLALLEADEGREPEAVRAVVEEDWEDDCRGQPDLSQRQWLDSLFELCDVWTLSVEPSEYAGSLRKPFRHRCHAHGCVIAC